jgi:hypothetical protein
MIDIRKGVSIVTDKEGREVEYKRGYYWAVLKTEPSDPFIVELRGDAIVGCGSSFYMFLTMFLEDYRIIRRVSVPKV